MRTVKLQTALRLLNVLGCLSLFMVSLNPPRVLLPLVAQSVRIPEDVVKAVNTRWPLPENASFYFKSWVTSEARARGYPETRVVIGRDHGYLYFQPSWQVMAFRLLAFMLIIDEVLKGILFVLASEAVRRQFQAQHADFVHRLHSLKMRQDIAGIALARFYYVLDCCCLAVSCLIDLVYEHVFCRPPPRAD